MPCGNQDGGDIVTDEKREVLWNAVEIFSTNMIMNFAICNREKEKDFEKRKDEEIEEILKKIHITIVNLELFQSL